MKLFGKKRSPSRQVAARPPRRGGSASLQTLGLAELRPSLFVLGRARRSFVVLTAPDGMVSTARRGALIGRNRSQVARIDRRGVRLLWSGGGVTARLLLPAGEPAKR
jgi:Tfp pilus assembly protein PilP